MSYEEILHQIQDAVASKASVLKLTAYDLPMIPEALQALPWLEELWIDSTEEWETLGYGCARGNITTVPSWIADFTNLKVLKLRGQALETLPPELGQLTHLTGLHVPENRLTVLPPEFGYLTA